VEEVAAPTRRFSALETTSGLPDDSREADDKQAERRLRELRASVKAARAVVSTNPGLAETLARDWQKAARFYGRFEITEAQFHHGARDALGEGADNPLEQSGSQAAGVPPTCPGE